MNISIIIPTLNEEQTLRETAAFLSGGRPGVEAVAESGAEAVAEFGAEAGVEAGVETVAEVGAAPVSPEVIVSDGGSSDQTVNVARRLGFKIVTGGRGRGPQLNRGAAVASGEVLFFLHSDTRPPPDFTTHIHKILNEPGTVAGVFRLAIDAPGAGYRLIETGANIRSRFFGTAYGDQGIFVQRETFLRAGGFADQPLFEDYQLIRRLQRLGRVRTAPVAVSTSARRWQRLGPLRTTLLNQALLGGYLLGLEPERLARFYYRRKDSGTKR